MGQTLTQNEGGGEEEALSLGERKVKMYPLVSSQALVNNYTPRHRQAAIIKFSRVIF